MMKYYKLGYRNHFKFVVRADVGISTVKSFYSPSRWWAKLAIRWRLYKLNIVRSSDMVALDLTGEEAILIKGNDAENQKYVVYKDRLNIVRKWSFNPGGIAKIKNEINALLHLKNSEYPFGHSCLIDYALSDSYGFLDIEYIDAAYTVECSDDFVRDYFNLFIVKNKGNSSVVHGDLTPWNIIRSTSKTLIIDWEEYRIGNKYYDILHYYYSYYKLGKSNSKASSLELALRRIEGLGLPLELSIMEKAIIELKLAKKIW